MERLRRRSQSATQLVRQRTTPDRSVFVPEHLKYEGPFWGIRIILSLQRPESPEYSAVYERFDRKRDEPPPAPAHAKQPEPSKAKPAENVQDKYRYWSCYTLKRTCRGSYTYRARSPPPDYDTGPSVTQSIATSIKVIWSPFAVYFLILCSWILWE